METQAQVDASKILKAHIRRRGTTKRLIGGVSGGEEMAFDEGVLRRLRALFEGRTDVVEKKMFGGIAFMVSGHMCCGVVGNELMARVGPEQYEMALRKPYAREMDFTGRPLKGFVYVGVQGFASDEDLETWVERCEQFVSMLPPK